MTWTIIGKLSTGEDVLVNENNDIAIERDHSRLCEPTAAEQWELYKRMSHLGLKGGGNHATRKTE